MIRLELCCFLVITTTSAFSLALIILMQLVEQFVFDNNSLCFFHEAPPPEKYLCQFEIVFSIPRIFQYFSVSVIGIWAWLGSILSGHMMSPHVTRSPHPQLCHPHHWHLPMLWSLSQCSCNDVWHPNHQMFFPSVWHSSFIHLYTGKCHTWKSIRKFLLRMKKNWCGLFLASSDFTPVSPRT